MVCGYSNAWNRRGSGKTAVDRLGRCGGRGCSRLLRGNRLFGKTELVLAFARPLTAVLGLLQLGVWELQEPPHKRLSSELFPLITLISHIFYRVLVQFNRT